jgi:glucose 1-dehydrogenase
VFAVNKKLKGKVALITGSDSGIGQATTIEMASEGADIVITYHTDQEGANKTFEEIKKLGHGA